MAVLYNHCWEQARLPCAWLAAAALLFEAGSTESLTLAFVLPCHYCCRTVNSSHDILASILSGDIYIYIFKGQEFSQGWYIGKWLIPY